MDSQYQAGMDPQVAKKAQYADQCDAGAALGRDVFEPLAQQIGRRLNRESENISNLYRAQDILLRHPEFEELVWLIRSGLI